MLEFGQTANESLNQIAHPTIDLFVDILDFSKLLIVPLVSLKVCTLCYSVFSTTKLPQCLSIKPKQS